MLMKSFVFVIEVNEKDNLSSCVIKAPNGQSVDMVSSLDDVPAAVKAIVEMSQPKNTTSSDD